MTSPWIHQIAQSLQPDLSARVRETGWKEVILLELRVGESWRCLLNLRGYRIIFHFLIFLP